MLAYPAMIIVILPFCFAQTIPPAHFNVRVAFFSGRNDPEWKVSSNKQLAQLLSDARIKGFAYTTDDMPVRLGYRGMLVKDLRTRREELIVGNRTTKLQQLLLSTMPKGLIEKGDLEEISNDIISGKIEADKSPRYKIREKRYAPPYDPQNWNTIEPIFKRRRCNNCYNYANRKATNNRAQPGYGGGHEFTQFNAADLILAAQRDGLTPLIPHPAFNQPVPGPPNDMSQHLVALAIRPVTPSRGGDHHWYRLDNNGQWSHKPGLNFVTQLDNAGALIVDPRKANIGTYQFASFMLTDPLTITIGSDWVCRPVYPDWERRKELHDLHFIKIATKS